MGGGLGLALNCDVRICSSDSKFRMPAGRLGLGYAFAGIKRFTEVVGFAHTPDLFFSARIFGPADAHHIGLIKQVFEVDQPAPQAWKRQRLMETGHRLGAKFGR